MKKTSLIIVGIVLILTFIGCTRGSSTSDVRNKLSQATSTSAETNAVAEQATKAVATEESMTEESTIPEQETEYDAEAAKKAFEESDIPESIKNIFLSDGEFIDTQTQKEMKLSEYKLYEVIYSYDDYSAESETPDVENECGVAEWCSYIMIDFDNDGKKELFYDFKPEITFNQGIIFHEHSDGKVYAYRHPSLRVNVSKDGDVLATAGATSPDWLLRYSFNTKNIIDTKITDYERLDNGEYKYYANGREIDESEYRTYMEHFWENRLDWTDYRITPDSEENQTSGN